MKIKINLNTIEKNPNAGNTKTFENTIKSCDFVTYKLPDFLVEDIDYFIINSYINPDKQVFECMFNGELTNDIYEKLKNLCLNVNITSQNNFHEHLPEPDYYFEYIHKYVKCPECGLKQKTNHYYCDSCESDLNIQLENIESALKRKFSKND